MLRLVHVLYGVQPKSTRQMPTIPAPWQQTGFTNVVTDSRTVAAGDLFVALAGDQTDGHRYLADVAARGATGALVNANTVAELGAVLDLGRPWVLVVPTTAESLIEAVPGSFLLIAVDDPLMAVQRLAVYHRRQFTPTVVGITGSVGKTTTKEVVAAVLSRRFRTLKTQRSFNTDVTVPATMLNLTHADEVAVLEMGMWATGEIRFLADLARPSVGIITNIGPSHLERMRSLDKIANAKAELIESLPQTGTAILNYDDQLVRGLAGRTRASVLFFGLDPAADVWASDVVSNGLEGITFTAHYQGARVDLAAPLLGRHMVYSALAATAAGLTLGLSWDEIAAGLRSGEFEARTRIVPGQGDVTIIDDAYNAAPISTLAALDLLAELDGRKVAVLADMLELGAAEESGHRSVGHRAAEVADLLVAVGQRSRWTAEAAVANGLPEDRLHTFATSDEAIAALPGLLLPGDNVLVKGSRGVAADRIVTALQRRAEESD